MEGGQERRRARLFAHIPKAEQQARGDPIRMPAVGQEKHGHIPRRARRDRNLWQDLRVIGARA